MRLKMAKSTAEEELSLLVSEGYKIASWMYTDYSSKATAGTYDQATDNKLYENTINAWLNKVEAALKNIFPTDLEVNIFAHPEESGLVSTGVNINYDSMRRRTIAFARGLQRIIEVNLSRYTDLPIKARLFLEDIDSFKKAKDINPAVVKSFLKDGYYLDLSEDAIQMGLEQVLDVSFHKKDWGGEENDLYTANVIVQGGRVASAFLLKGNGLKRHTLEIANCGSNGDQLVRLIQSPAQLFFIQFVGEVSENVIKDMEGKVELLKNKGKDARYCILNGQDTARILYAYNILQKLMPV